MESVIRQSIELVRKKERHWALPLISDLESQLKHSAILWVKEVTQYYLNELPSSCEFKASWLELIRQLEAIVIARRFVDIEYLHRKSRKIFNSPSTENTIFYPSILARLFSAECRYRNLNYDLYLRGLWETLESLIINLNADSEKIYAQIIKSYQKFVENEIPRLKE